MRCHHTLHFVPTGRTDTESQWCDFLDVVFQRKDESGRVEFRILADLSSDADPFLAGWVPLGGAESTPSFSFLTHKRNNKNRPWEKKPENEMIGHRESDCLPEGLYFLLLPTTAGLGDFSIIL